MHFNSIFIFRFGTLDIIRQQHNTVRNIIDRRPFANYFWLLIETILINFVRKSLASRKLAKINDFGLWMRWESAGTMICSAHSDRFLRDNFWNSPQSDSSCTGFDRSIIQKLMWPEQEFINDIHRSQLYRKRQTYRDIIAEHTNWQTQAKKWAKNSGESRVEILFLWSDDFRHISIGFYPYASIWNLFLHGNKTNRITTIFCQCRSALWWTLTLDACVSSFSYQSLDKKNWRPYFLTIHHLFFFDVKFCIQRYIS